MKEDTPAIPAILFLVMYAAIVFGFIYSGIRGLRGRQIALFNRGGVSGTTTKGKPARLIGLVYLLIGLLFLIMPFVYSARQH